MNVVDAQQARRVLDRIVGYKMSPLLWKKSKRGLSAGRVQSVAVKLIVDRENEIEGFKPEEYWNIYAKLKDEKTKKQFEARFYGKNGKKLEIHSKQETDEVLEGIKNAKYIVSEVKKGKRKEHQHHHLQQVQCNKKHQENLDLLLRKLCLLHKDCMKG